MAENPNAFPSRLQTYHSGMTLRDWFAGQVLRVMPHHDWSNAHACQMAEYAYAIADAMLAARTEQHP